MMILLFLIIMFVNKNRKINGSSYRLLYDLAFPDDKILGDTVETTPELETTMNKFDEKHNNYIKYLCDYISDIEIETNQNDKYIVVGDVHGSILQLFMPLKQARIIDKIEFLLTNSNPFKITYYNN